jgi:glycosyltransferase involved in cell wall biosynthesis
VIADYYRSSYGCDSEVIAYGARAHRREAGEILDKFGLKSRNFILYLSRLEPENNALGVIEAYNGLDTDIPLVIVGDAPYAREYINRLKEIASPKVIFTGYQFGEAYHELQSNCLLYVQATEVGGTHPALIESMAYGNCVIANGTPENLEVLGSAGTFYLRNDFADLRARLEELLADRAEIDRFRELARERAASVYNWERIVDQYEDLFRRFTGA